MKWLTVFALVIFGLSFGSCDLTTTLAPDDEGTQTCGEVTCTVENSSPFGDLLVFDESSSTGQYLCLDFSANISALLEDDSLKAEIEELTANLQSSRLIFTNQCVQEYEDIVYCDLLEEKFDELSVTLDECSTESASGALNLSSRFSISAILICCLYFLK